MYRFQVRPKAAKPANQLLGWRYGCSDFIAGGNFSYHLILGERGLQQMQACCLGEDYFQLDRLSKCNAKSSFIVIGLQIKLDGSFKTNSS